MVVEGRTIKNQTSVPQLFPATWTSPSPSVTNFTPRTSGSSSRSRVTIEDSGSTLSWSFLQSTDCSFFVTVVHLSRVCRLEMLCQLWVIWLVQVIVLKSQPWQLRHRDRVPDLQSRTLSPRWRVHQAGLLLEQVVLFCTSLLPLSSTTLCLFD